MVPDEEEQIFQVSYFYSMNSLLRPGLYLLILVLVVLSIVSEFQDYKYQNAQIKIGLRRYSRLNLVNSRAMHMETKVTCNLSKNMNSYCFKQKETRYLHLKADA